MICCRVLAEQAERAVKDQQTLLEHKETELRSVEEQIQLLEEQISSLKHVSEADRDELAKLRATVAELDREKDELQIAVDEKTEQEASRMDAVAARVSADVNSNAAHESSYHSVLIKFLSLSHLLCLYFLNFVHFFLIEHCYVY